MMAFFSALQEYHFLQYALIAGMLASIGCGISGPLVLVNRISYLAGGIAHAVLGGIGAAVYFQFNPLVGALITALMAALIIALIKLRFAQQEEIVIGALWAVGMASGILFMAKTPGYNTDLISYLFGNILMVSPAQLWVLAGLDMVLLVVFAWFYQYFIAISFDQEFARTRAVPVAFFYTLLLCLIAITIVVMIQVVGLILVIALLTLPASIAALFTQSLLKMMLLAMLTGIVFTMGGLAFAYQQDLPAGASIIILTALGYLVFLGYSSWRQRQK